MESSSSSSSSKLNQRTSSIKINASPDSSFAARSRRRSSRLSRISYRSMDSCKYSSSKYSSYHSSLELRRLPVDDLLIPPEPSKQQDDVTLIAIPEKQRSAGGGWFFFRTCINSKVSLKMQLISTFGTINTLTVLIVTTVCICTAIVSGNSVKNITHSNYDTLSRETMGTTARYLAEALSSQLIPKDVIEILAEAVQDRFAGYPDHPGYDNDELVPFFDVESQRNKYPIIGEPLPLDWEIVANVNEENYMEHVQNRWSLYNERDISTRTATFYMQGMCDPSVTDDHHATYYPNCTNENNNIETGGVIAPTPTNHQVHRKASDLTPLLKSVYEYHQELFLLAIYFANGGSGATTTYPHLAVDTNNNYESIGCDWLLETPNPYDSSRPIINDEVARERILQGGACRPNGETVSTRAYNPMERAWCRNQAINPHKIHVEGPFLDAWNPGYTITVGRAVYDKLTNEFISCIGVDFAFNSFEKSLLNSSLSTNAQVSVVRYDEMGTVFVSTAWNTTIRSTPMTIDAIGAGVSASAYQELYSLVNYNDYANGNNAWNATEIRSMYEEFVYHDGESGYRVTGYPIPSPPADKQYYHSDYVPEFLAVVSVPIDEVYEEVDPLLEKVDSESQRLVLLCVVTGLVGLCIIVITIIIVSNVLTAPLKYLNEIANGTLKKKCGAENSDSDGSTTAENKSITEVEGVQGIGSKDESNLKDETSLNKDDSENEKVLLQYEEFKQWKCVPRTEINDVVEKFKKMVSHFTGDSMATSIRVKERELRNGFSPVNHFKELYLKREKKEEAGKKQFVYNFHSRALSPSLNQINFGTNAKHESLRDSLHSLDGARSERFMEKKRGKSSLFSWIVALMVMPFLLTAAAMTCIVSSTTFFEFSNIIDDIKNDFVSYKVNALNIYVQHRAHLVSVFMERPVRDLHVITRYTSWLLFDGIARADSFTEVVSNIEQCKIWPEQDQCETVIHARTCDCAWDDHRGTCENYTTVDTRYLQKMFYATQSQDTWPNGDRNFTSYPDVATSARTTAWFDDVDNLPGSQEGSMAAGYATTYSRLRAFSANPVVQTLYNKDAGSRIHLGGYVGFEADGTLIGYEGCSYPPHEGLAYFESDEVTEQARPELCPSGKFGFDSRCRGWYVHGSRNYVSDRKYLYVTPPYEYAGQFLTGQSCTSPLIDPTTGEHVGQTLVDFIVTPINSSLSDQQTPLSEGGFPFLITATSEVNDTILGPGFVFENLRPIADVLFADDPVCKESKNCTHRRSFQPIVDEMKAGKNGVDEFTITTPSGHEAKLYVAFAPVTLNSNTPLDSSDFSRGVEPSDHLIYSLALAETENSLLGQWDDMQRHLNWVVIVSLIVMVSVVCLASVCVVYISYHIALSVSDPMLYLSDLIGYINRLDRHGDTPDIDVNRRGHSLEVVNVSKTIESLYNVIRSANVAFFAGDTERAYFVLTDILEVYRRLNNQKGISIACNNLGNTMLAVYRSLDYSGNDHFCGFKNRQIVSMGLRYFHEAIQLGEKAYDAFYEAQGWSPSCLEFMQHLSNRYFNRAMFLLTVKDTHEQPKEIEELGFRDLQIAHDMDTEIVAEGMQAGWGIRTVDMHFNVALNRIRGHLYLQEMGYPDEFEVKEILDDAFDIIRIELEKEQQNSMLFKDMSPAGRMQQIETELMRYFMLKNDIPTAARIAIRMLVEDEYILLDAQRKAVEVLINYTASSEFLEEQEHSHAQRARVELHKYQTQLETNEVLLTERSNKKSSSRTATGSFSIRRSLHIRECNLGDVTMEAF